MIVINMMKKKKVTKKADKVEKPSAKVLVKEDVFTAKSIAELLDISSFDYYGIKKQNNINDDTFLTVKEFQEMYKNIRGR